MKKKYIIGAFILSLLVVIFLFIKEIEVDKKIDANTNDKNISIDEKRNQLNTISFGLKDSDGKHTDNGSSINNQGEKVTVYISLDHNIDENRKYGLIILEDYKQIQFKINTSSSSVKRYFFDMEPLSSKNIKVSLNINKNASDLTFLLIKKPEYTLKELDLDKASILEEVLSMRYSINKNNNKVKFKDTEANFVLKDGLNEDLFITNNKSKLQTVITENEGEKLLLSAGNDSDKEIKYAIVAFNNWEQKKIIKDKDIIYTSISPNSRNIFDFQLPDVEQESNFQFIAFPYPYEVSKDNNISQKSYGTFRVVIKNK